jgi:hypothetical protein
MLATLLALAILVPPVTVPDPPATAAPSFRVAPQPPRPQPPAAEPEPSPAVPAEGPAAEPPTVDQSTYVAQFLAAASGEQIGLRDERGGIAMGRLVRVDGRNAIVRFRGRELVVPTRHIEMVETRNDRPWDGAVKGLVVGLSLWAMIIAQGDTGLDTVEDTPDDFTLADTVGMVGSLAALGFAIDYVHEARRTIYVAPMPRDPVAQGGAQAAPARGRRLLLSFRKRF